jgi:hypothetical protein
MGSAGCFGQGESGCGVIWGGMLAMWWDAAQGLTGAGRAGWGEGWWGAAGAEGLAVLAGEHLTDADYSPS